MEETLKTLDNESLLNVFMGACYLRCHSNNKSAVVLDCELIKAEVLRRLEGVEE